MGACLSCLGLDGQHDHDSDADTAPLLDPTFQPAYGTHDVAPHPLRERDPEAVRRENAALENICVRISSRLVDVMHDETDDDDHAHPPMLAVAPPAEAAAPRAPAPQPHPTPPPLGSTTLFQEPSPDVRLEKDRREAGATEDAGGKRREVSAWLQSVVDGETDGEADARDDDAPHVGTMPLLSRGAERD